MTGSGPTGTAAVGAPPGAAVGVADGAAGGLVRATLDVLRPKLLGLAGPGRRRQAGARRLVSAVAAGLLGAAAVHLISLRLLRALLDVPEVGPLLASKLLGLALLLFLCILVLANVIAALSSFFLARDLPTILAAPVDWLAVYGARLTETLVTSSWMVLLLLLPVLAAYQVAYGTGGAFYGLALLALLPFLVLPAAVGSAVTLLLVRVFPARRTRDLLGFVAAAGIGLLVLGLRVLQPERLVRPEGFRNLVEFLVVLEGPSSVWMPSEWVAAALGGWLEGRFDPFWLLLLWTTAAAAVVLGAALHRRLYGRGFTRAQEGGASRVRNAWAWRVLGSALAPVGIRRRELVLKDLRLFFRDPVQWSQLLILGVLLVVYVYNVRVLPLRSSEAIGGFLVSVIALLNLGLAGFVLAAVAARFVFPAFSLEGPALWLLRSSPLPPGSLLWSKFWTQAAALLVLALVLTGLTNVILGVETALLWLSLASIVLITLALVAQALAWGVALPRFEAENPAQIPTSLGGLLFMMGALANLGAVLFAQFWSLRGWLTSGLPGRTPRGASPEEVGMALLATVLLCGVGTVLPYAVARARVERLGE